MHVEVGPEGSQRSASGTGEEGHTLPGLTEWTAHIGILHLKLDRSLVDCICPGKFKVLELLEIVRAPVSCTVL